MSRENSDELITKFINAAGRGEVVAATTEDVDAKVFKKNFLQI